MKIDTSSFQSQTPRSGVLPAKVSEKPSQASEAVSLSRTASDLLTTEKPPVNASKIQEIKDAIAQGRFRINPEAIADSLIQTARDLVNSQRKA